jgi:hypothetical protein
MRKQYHFRPSEAGLQAWAIRLIEETDLSHAIILDPDGRVMDGMHRVAKALSLGQTHIKARRLAVLPEPDYLGVEPDELPYG